MDHDATHVVGVIGDVTDDLRRRVTAPRPGWGRIDLGTDDVLLLAQGRHHAWRSAGGRGAYWMPQGDVSAVRSVDDAMHRAVAPGIAVAPDGVVTLHAGAWGYQPVHVAAVGPTTLVLADTVAAVLDLLDGPLDPDWDAWAAIFSLRYTMDGLTPFEQVRVLRGAEERRWDPATQTISAHRGLPRA
ncbi:MAG: asparagine synthetase family protein, partial [Aeromicrobium sp.]|uniref:hypothetical protein n=1 Tax=Aeromicrobium sp. TaxID=1871063 RepID=UPI00262BDC86